MSRRPKIRESNWFGHQQALDAWGRTDAAFRSSILPCIREENKRVDPTAANKTQYYLRGTIDDWVEQRLADAEQDRASVGDSDAPSDPDLKAQYDFERVRKLKMANDEKEGQLVDQEEIRKQLGDLARMFREFSEWLQKRGDAEQFDRLQQLLDVFEAGVVANNTGDDT